MRSSPTPVLCGLTLFLVAAAGARPALAQVPRPDERFMISLPEMERVDVTAEQKYAASPERPLLFDLYRPPGNPVDRKPPVVLLVNGIGDAPDFRLRTHFQYTGWGRYLAASGLAAVTFDVRRETVRDDILSLIDYLKAHAGELGIDAGRMAFWSCSANVSAAWRVAGNDRPPGLKCAVFYYGNAQDSTLIGDLPVQIVKSELDAEMINRGIDAMLTRLVAAGAPLEYVMVPGARHAFDVRDDNELTRSVMRSTVDYLKTWLSPEAQERIEATAGRRDALRLFKAQQWEPAALGFEAWLSEEPWNGEVANRLAQCYYSQRLFSDAARAYQRSIDNGFMVRLTAYNGACCYALTGDVERALALLKMSREAGQVDLSGAWRDQDLESLRGDPRFQEIVGPRPGGD